MNNNTKRRVAKWRKAVRSETGKNPQSMPRKSKRAKVGGGHKG